MIEAAKRGPTAIQAYYVLFGFAALLLLGTAALAIKAGSSIREDIGRVTHTLMVQREAAKVPGLIGVAEFAHRRAIATGNESFVRDFRAAIVETRQQIDSLLDLTDDDPGQQKRLERLRLLVRDYTKSSTDTVELFERFGVEASRRDIALGESGFIVLSIRNEVQGFLGEESLQFDLRSQKMEHTLNRLLLVVGFGMVIAALAATWGFWLLRRGLQQRARLSKAESDTELARRASREKSAFLASMSHEFRTPMNAIFGFTQLLSGTVRGQREQQYVRAIVSSGKSLLALINDVLDLSKIEAGKLDLNIVPTDPRELIDGTLAVFSQMAIDKGLQLKSTVDPSVPAGLMLDPARIRQVLINLIGNAVKYTEKGTIEVRLRTVGEGDTRAVRLEVVDTGIGIAEDVQDRIFDPFVQSEGVDGKKREGTGLGLSITRRLAELMGGELGVESRIGRGSTFSIRLPVVGVTAAPRTSDSDSWDGIDFGELTQARILVVDDVEWNRQLIEAFFLNSGHILSFATDGEEALAHVLANHPEIVLMDVRMPKMDGREAQARIRAALGEDAPKIIAVTASSLSGEEASLRRVFDGYVRKPFSKAELFSELSRFLAPKSDARASAKQDDDLEPVDSEAVDSAALVDDARRFQIRARLQEVRDLVWPRLQRTLPMRECRELGQELRALGRELAASPLRLYGERLESAADGFDVMKVESLLDQLPSHLPDVSDFDARDIEPSSLATDSDR